MKCSDFIAQYLQMKGISHVFDYTGGMIANLEDSISRQKGIECLPVRHEQAAGFAAEGYARAGKNFGVAIATSGPGATNMITPIGSCFFDSTPVLFITGQVNSRDLKKDKEVRQNGFQELDIVDIVKSITKYAKLVTDPGDILYELEKSLFLMRSGRPGPVLVDLPFDVQVAEVDQNELRSYFDSPEHRDYLGMLESRNGVGVDLASLIKDSRSPLILCGNGIKLSETKDDLIRFSRDCNLPIVSSLMGLGELPSDLPNNVGFIGTYGNRVANITLANSDLLIVLGSRLDLRQTGNPALFFKEKIIVHVDIDKYSAKDISDNYFFIRSDLRFFFKEQRDIKVAKKENWFDFIEQVRREFCKEEGEVANECLKPNDFLMEFSKIAPVNSTVIADVGQNQMWLAQSWFAKKDQNIIFSGGMGSMGFALPVSIGAFCSDNTRPVFAFMGDGGFQMNLQELETVKYNNFPIKIIVLNNESLGMVREFQDEYFNKNYQSTVIGYSCPNIEKISDAYGLKYYRLDGVDGINEMIKGIVEADEPVILEVRLDIKSTLRPKVVYGESIESQIPPLSSKKQKKLLKLKKDYLK